MIRAPERVWVDAERIEWIEPGIREFGHARYSAAQLQGGCETLSQFIGLPATDIASRYAVRHGLRTDQVAAELSRKAHGVTWGAVDLLVTKTPSGELMPTVLEFNSCGAGLKSMLPVGDTDPYLRFAGLLLRDRPGPWAVLADKNQLETRGIAEAIATTSDSRVGYVWDRDDDTPPWVGRSPQDRLSRHGFDAVFRYITSDPAVRLKGLPERTLHNPVRTCLAGGRDKWHAHQAWLHYNQREDAGVHINVLPTVLVGDAGLNTHQWEDQLKTSIAIGKPRHGNAGKGIMLLRPGSPRPRLGGEYVVQPLVLPRSHADEALTSGIAWTEAEDQFSVDVRIQLINTDAGWWPTSAYCRRSAMALPPRWCDLTIESVLTNLSIGHGQTDPNRALPMTDRNLRNVGLTGELLVDAYVQAVTATNAIDAWSRSIIKCPF